MDDQSDDGTFETFKTLIYSLNKLKHRTILIQNIKNVGSLGNKELMVRNYCEHDDIVIDLDADDSLVGSQVLQLLNTLYQSTNYWFIYSNNFFQRPSKSYHESGLCTDIPNKNWKNNSYRT